MSSLNFATQISTLTPLDGTGTLQYKSDSTYYAEEWLGEPQPDVERGKQFGGNDGVTSITIHKFWSGGKRDVTLFDCPFSDQLIGWAQQNPTVHFNYTWQYQRDENDTSSIRRVVHSDCFIENTPSRTGDNEKATIKFTMKYARIEIQDGQGNPVG